MNPRHVIFDLDGTLVDSNAYHAEAWGLAFAEHSVLLPQERITREIGKGGDGLVRSLIGHEAYERIGENIAERQGEKFTLIARERKLALLNGAKELIDALRRRGIKIALCTSSNEKHLDVIAETSGTDFRELVDVVVTKADAATKPAGDPVAAAVNELQAFAGTCVMVGDTRFDVEAARRAGVVTVGIDAGERALRKRLRTAGARYVTRDPAALLETLDRAFAKALPLPIEIDADTAERLMRRALDTAAEGLGAGEAPIGCVIADRDGRVVASAHNAMNARQSKIAHAEIAAFGKLEGVLPPDAKGLILVSTLEPCVMCAAAAMESATDTIIFALQAPPDSGTLRVRPPRSPEATAPRVIGGVLMKESRALLKKFLDRSPVPRQRAYVQALLKEV